MTTTPAAGGFGERSTGAPEIARFGRRGAAVGLVAVVAVVAALVLSVVYGRATAASHPRLFGGSLVLDDERPLTVVNLATGEVTVQLAGVSGEVGADSYSDVQAVAATDGTWLVNRVTGTFNLLAEDNYVVDPTGGGVGLGTLAGATAAAGFASGSDAYIVRQAPRSTVSLVDRATVEEGAKAAAGTTGTAPTTVLPRGFAAVGGEIDLVPGAAVSAGGSLWALVTTTGATPCALDELTPTDRGHNGLVARTRTRLSTACSTAALSASGSTVALATPGRVAVYRPGRPVATRAVRATAGATTFLPVTGSGPTVWFLARTATAWNAMGVPASGVGAVGVHALRGVAVTASPAPPVQQNGELYSLDRAAAGQPALWIIDPADGRVGTVKAVATYPAKSAAEQASFTQAEVVGSGPRVVYNNPGSLLAVVVFTDGSHAPVVVDKSSAVVVTPSGPASVAAQGLKKKAAPSGSTSPTTTPAPAKPAPTVNQQVNCADTTQKPYAPQVTGVTPASETALVSWSYQPLDQQDCEPDSWSVSLTAVGAPQPAAPVQTENGQQQLDVTGLRPTTTYRAVVTAYINKQSTASQPVTFRTREQGPDAPASVHTSVTSSGSWVVSWTRCHLSTCYVPADQWTVTASACGSGYVGQPPTTTVAGSTTTATFDAAALNLLGQSLTFRVQGSLADGLAGNPRSDGACTQSWRAPQASSISLSAAGIVTGSTITAHLQVQPASSSASVYGSLHTEFTYHVGTATVGPTTAQSVTIPGLAPNRRYVPTVTVTPVGHPSAAVTVRGTPFRQNLSWSPALSVSTAAHVDADPNSGTVVATFANLAPGSYTTNGTITCASTSVPVSAPVSGSTATFPHFDLDSNGGDCSLTLTVHDTATPNPYGVASPALNAAVNWGNAPNDAFTAAYTQTCDLTGCSTSIALTANSSSPLGGTGWTVVAKQQNSTSLSNCQTQQTYDQAPTNVNLVIRGGCPSVDSDPLSVTITYTYFGQAQTSDATVTGQSGTVPTTTTTVPVTTTTVPVPTTPTSLSTPITVFPPPSASTTTSTTAGATPSTSGAAAAAARSTTGPTALVATDGSSGPGGGDPAPGRTLLVLLAGLVAVGLFAGPKRRHRRRAGAGKGPR